MVNIYDFLKYALTCQELKPSRNKRD